METFSCFYVFSRENQELSIRGSPPLPSQTQLRFVALFPNKTFSSAINPSATNKACTRKWSPHRCMHARTMGTASHLYKLSSLSSYFISATVWSPLYCLKIVVAADTTLTSSLFCHKYLRCQILREATLSSILMHNFSRHMPNVKRLSFRSVGHNFIIAKWICKVLFSFFFYRGVFSMGITRGHYKNKA